MLRIFMILGLMLSSAAFAQRIDLDAKLLSTSEIVRLIGPFPQLGSPLETEDYKALLYYQTHRTAQDCAEANRDVSTDLSVMFGGEKGVLSPAEVSKYRLFLLKAYATAGVNAYKAKSAFKRPRPYVNHPDLKPCIPLEETYSYPSGHSMVAQLYGRILSKLLPEREGLIMNRAMEFSLHRVVGGVHHPSDVHAAHLLADELALKMIEVESFVNELELLQN